MHNPLKRHYKSITIPGHFGADCAFFANQLFLLNVQHHVGQFRQAAGIGVALHLQRAAAQLFIHSFILRLAETVEPPVGGGERPRIVRVAHLRGRPPMPHGRR